jgi:phosphoribosylformimino-5-aminoimidazole carboxamide ribotide isomerase
MQFRPCIDLKDGKVVQIVGGTLKDGSEHQTSINHESTFPSSHFAQRYKDDELKGGHVIALGKGNEQAAIEALKAFPGGMHYGGGVNLENALLFLEAGASHVIVTSFIFLDGQLSTERLAQIEKKVGKKRLVLDLSCRKRDGRYWVTCDRWQTFTSLQVNKENLSFLSEHCDEFLIHGADVEGRRSGIEDDLVHLLGEHCPIPCTYAGGVRALSDFETVKQLGNNQVHLTVGSALDLFGGDLPYHDVLSWHQKNMTETTPA